MMVYNKAFLAISTAVLFLTVAISYSSFVESHKQVDKLRTFLWQPLNPDSDAADRILNVNCLLGWPTGTVVTRLDGSWETVVSRVRPMVLDVLRVGSSSVPLLFGFGLCVNLVLSYIIDFIDLSEWGSWILVFAMPILINLTVLPHYVGPMTVSSHVPQDAKDLCAVVESTVKAAAPLLNHTFAHSVAMCVVFVCCLPVWIWTFHVVT